MSDTAPRPGTADTRSAAAPDGRVATTPRYVGVAWALLAVNVMGFYDKPDLLVPLPKPVAQVITMGALVAAFAVALIINPRVRVRPSSYLLLMSLLTLVSVASSMQLESGIGALFRCFRLALFVATLWLLSAWWRGDLRFARYHLRTVSALMLLVLAGLAVKPGASFNQEGRLVGSIWPIPSPQVGLYCAIGIGLAVMLWLTRSLDGRSAALVAVPAVVMLLLSHTRTAMVGLVVALAVSGLSLVFSNVRARRSIAGAAVVVVLVAAAFGQIVQDWLARGQDSEQLTSLTGRARVWDQLLEVDRTLGQQVFGIGLTDKSFNGLAIDSTWLSIYHEQGIVGVAIVVAILVVLIFTAAMRPPSPARACAVFLIVYCAVASYTEVGIGDASPYLLCLAAAASLLVRDSGIRADQVRPVPL